MKRIVFLISKMDIGGAEKVFRDLALGFSAHKDRYKVSVVCLYGKGPLGEELADRGIKVYERLLCHKYDIPGLFRTVGAIRREKPDILYVAGQTLSQAIGLTASLLLAIPGKIIGVHSHDLADRTFYSNAVDRVSFRWADFIVCVSESQKRHLIFHKKVPAEKIKVIYNGIDINKKGEGVLRKEFSLTGDSALVGTVASLRKEKGLDVLIKSAPFILNDYPDTFFVIAGKGKERQGLENLAVKVGVKDRVVFLGERRDIHNVIASLDIACLSSRTENFPLSILECMAQGKAIVATKVGGVPEMVKDGTNGFLVEKENARELAEKVGFLIKNKVIRAAMGMEGRRTVKNFSLKKMLDRYDKLFDRVS